MRVCVCMYVNVYLCMYMFGYTYRTLGTHVGVVAIAECGAFLQGVGVHLQGMVPYSLVLSLGWASLP